MGWRRTRVAARPGARVFVDDELVGETDAELGVLRLEYDEPPDEVSIELAGYELARSYDTDPETHQLLAGGRYSGGSLRFVLKPK